MRYLIALSALPLLLACEDATIVAVGGRVVDYSLRALPGIEVRVNAGGPVFTDADGTFSMAGVRSPYDVALRDTSTNAIILYRQLRRADPTLQAVNWSVLQMSWSTIRGRLSGGTGHPAPPNHYVVMAFISPRVFSDFNISGWSSATGDYTINVPNPSTPSSGTVHALQFDMGAPLGDGGPNGPVFYKGYGTRANVPTPATGTEVTGQDVAMAGVQTDSVSGTVSLPAGYTMGQKQLVLTYPGSSPASVPIWTDHTGNPEFKFRFVRTNAVSFDMLLQLGAPTGHLAYTKTALGQAPQVFNITLPVGLSLVAPADQSTGTTMDTEFRWRGPANSVYVFFVPGTGRFTQVVTTATSLRLSELTSLGVALTPGTPLSWYVQAHGPFNSLDDAVSARGLRPSGDNFLLDVMSWRFTP